MHNDDIERLNPGSDRPSDDSPREAVTAADDTGLVSQQEVITESELGEQLPDDAEAGGP